MTSRVRENALRALLASVVATGLGIYAISIAPSDLRAIPIVLTAIMVILTVRGLLGAVLMIRYDSERDTEDGIR